MVMPEWIDFPVISDPRGDLIALEANKQVPFDIKRIYYLYNIPSDVRRGYHSHKKLQQVAIPLSGSCKFLLENGSEKVEVVLNDRTKGLVIRENVWHEMWDFSTDCLLMVLASDFYDESDYVRDYQQFLEEQGFANDR